MRAIATAFGAIALFCAAWATRAAAQPLPSIDIRTWRPSIDPEAGLVLEPAATPGPWRWNVALWTAYAEAPVTLHDTAGQLVSRPLERVLSADLVAGIGLGERAAAGIDIPFFLWQKGATSLPSSVVSGGTVPTTGVGDLALLGKVAVVSNDRQGVHAGLGVSLLGAVTFPSGDRTSFMSDGSTTASLSVLTEYALGVGAARAALGYKLRTEQHVWPEESGGVSIGDEIPWSFDLVLRPKAVVPRLDADDRQQWELGVHGALPARPIAPFGFGRQGASVLSTVLLAAGDRIALGHHRDSYLLIGGDFGLDEALGVPAARAIISFGWAPRTHDRDSDDIPDDIDECPDLPEDKDGIQDQDGCPEDDADGDGVLDTQDACPLVPGEASNLPATNGCPPRGP